MKRLGGMLLILLAVFVMPGCAFKRQPALEIDYYTLEYEALPVEGLGGPLPVVLRLQRFSASPEFSTERMVYREAPNRLAADYYNRWRANPADLVTSFLGRDLAAGGLFTGVALPGSGLDATHVLEGNVEEFLEIAGDACEAALAVNVILFRAGEPDAAKGMIFQRRVTAREKCEARSPALAAEAMSRAMARVSAEIGKAVYSELKKDR